MIGIYFILPTLLVIFISLLVVRGAAIALMMTGMDQKRARFQALSAFTGTGFTTKEAELIVNHPQRRQIATWLMILGNAGLVTLIVTATSSFVTSEGYQLPISAVILVAGGYLVYKLASRAGFTRRWERFIENRLIKSHAFEEGATEDLLHLIEGYGLVRAIITEDSPFVGHSLAEVKSQLPEDELLVLGIERGKKWLPLPRAEETINKGDKLVVYGLLNTLKTAFSEE